MSEHNITVVDRRHVKQRMEFTGNALTEAEIMQTNTLQDATRTFSCSCGKGGMDYQEAVEHMKSANARVTPDTFREVAHELHKKGTIPVGERENGYVLEGEFPDTDYADNPLQRGVVVAMATGDKHVVALMKRGKETVGQNDYKLKTRENIYVKAKFYEVDLLGEVASAQDIGQACVERGERIGKGYVNGYRVKNIKRTLKEIFKYYAT